MIIVQSQKRSKVMQQAVLKINQQGRRRHAVRMSRRYLRSFPAKVTALVASYTRKVASWHAAPLSDLRDLVNAAGALSVWEGADEKATAYQKPKRSGGYRWIHRHGLIQYALELLAADGAKCCVNLQPTQFLPQGGIPKFAAWLQQNIGKTELVITLDIPRCFDEIRRSSLVDNLPLPRWAVKRVLFDPMDNATYFYPGLAGPKAGHGPIANVSSAMRGAPQGSALSQLASEVVIGLVMQAVLDVHPSVLVASYGDNLIVLLSDASHKASVLSALSSAISKHFGADVSAELTCRINCARPTKGFWFCRRFYMWKKGGLAVHLPPDWVHSFWQKTHDRIEAAMVENDQATWDSIERGIKGWMRHSPKNDAVINMAVDLLAHVKLLRN